MSHWKPGDFFSFPPQKVTLSAERFHPESFKIITFSGTTFFRPAFLFFKWLIGTIKPKPLHRFRLLNIWCQGPHWSLPSSSLCLFAASCIWDREGQDGEHHMLLGAEGANWDAADDCTRDSRIRPGTHASWPPRPGPWDGDGPDPGLVEPKDAILCNFVTLQWSTA